MHLYYFFFAFTTTLIVAFLPFAVLTVMVAVPAFYAVTTPFALTAPSTGKLATSSSAKDDATVEHNKHIISMAQSHFKQRMGFPP